MVVHFYYRLGRNKQRECTYECRTENMILYPVLWNDRITSTYDISPTRTTPLASVNLNPSTHSTRTVYLQPAQYTSLAQTLQSSSL